MTSVRAAAPVLPVVAVVAALALPITQGAEGGATPADAVSGCWCCSAPCGCCGTGGAP